jgi:hypothetical protein
MRVQWSVRVRHRPRWFQSWAIAVAIGMGMGMAIGWGGRLFLVVVCGPNADSSQPKDRTRQTLKVRKLRKERYKVPWIYSIILPLQAQAALNF